MEKMQWYDDLSVGIELIDNQHKKWIEHFNNVVDAVNSGQSQANIIKTLGFLTDYIDVHFSTEEKYMLKNNYPALENHRTKHEELRQTVENLVHDFQEEGVTETLAKAVEILLGNWLVKHIEEADKEFGKFIKEKEIDLPKE
jgi:hemerythrin